MRWTKEYAKKEKRAKIKKKWSSDKEIPSFQVNAKEISEDSCCSNTCNRSQANKLQADQRKNSRGYNGRVSRCFHPLAFQRSIHGNWLYSFLNHFLPNSNQTRREKLLHEQCSKPSGRNNKVEGKVALLQFKDLLARSGSEWVITNKGYDNSFGTF